MNKQWGGSKLATLMIILIIAGVICSMAWFGYLAMTGPRM